MPLSISEIGVRIAVDEAGSGASGAPDRAGGAAGACGDASAGCGTQLSDAQHRAIVEDSVRAVLAALRQREAR